MAQRSETGPIQELDLNYKMTCAGAASNGGQFLWGGGWHPPTALKNASTSTEYGLHLIPPRQWEPWLKQSVVESSKH